MDPIALGFYACVCGLLGLVAPSLGGAIARVAVGAGVGLVAAILLPWVGSTMGYG